MTGMSRILLHVARWVAGRKRREWIEAMAAEAAAAGGHSTAWALGCLWASLEDRFWRDWWFAVAIVFLPLFAMAWKGMVFFSTSWLLSSGRIPGWIAVACWILSPFPLVFLVARWRQGLSATVALAIGFVLAEFAPIVLMWVDFGLAPSSWFGPHVHWYKADPNIVIGAAAGLTLDLVVWLTAAWLGWRSHTARARNG